VTDLERKPQADLLLAHLERDLGPYTGRGVARPEWELDFSVLRFADRPEPGVSATVTLGLSAHVLEGSDRRPRRQELLVALRSELDESALEIAANVGAYVLDRHVAVLEGESIALPPPARDDSRLDTLFCAQPEPFPRLARCGDGVEVVWLLPCARAELHIATEHGVPDLLHWIREGGEDPYDLGRTPVL
jgi:hypothetical protein